jgi:hypothetical protein
MLVHYGGVPFDYYYGSSLRHHVPWGMKTENSTLVNANRGDKRSQGRASPA